jgi:hypothetical protein
MHEVIESSIILMSLERYKVLASPSPTQQDGLQKERFGSGYQYQREEGVLTFSNLVLRRLVVHCLGEDRVSLSNLLHDVPLHLHSLELQWSAMTDETVWRILQKTPDLGHLHLEGSCVLTGRFLADLSQIGMGGRIQRLTVKNCRQFQAGMLDSYTPNLSDLTLIQTQFSQRCLEAIGRLPALQALTLEIGVMSDPAQFDINAISGLRGMSRLELQLFASNVWQALPATFLLSIPDIWGGLEVFSLRGFGLAIHSFSFAGCLPKLKVLDLTYCGYVDLASFVGNSGCSQFRSISSLKLAGNVLNTFASISALTSLTSLVLQYTQVDVKGLTALLSLPNLRKLDVTECGWLTESALGTLRGLSACSELHISMQKHSITQSVLDQFIAGRNVALLKLFMYSLHVNAESQSEIRKDIGDYNEECLRAYTVGRLSVILQWFDSGACWLRD